MSLRTVVALLLVLQTNALISRAAAQDLGFSLQLHRQLANGENVVHSPVSVSDAFALVYPGARGDTAQEIRSLFHFTSGGATVSDPQSGGGVTIRTANSVYLQKGYPVLPSFKSALAELGSSVSELDFVGDGDNARNTINQSVAKQTEQKIPNLLVPPFPSPMTRVVLVNAMYFKGLWALAFKEQFTREAPFTLENGETVTVPYLSDRREVEAAFTNDYRAAYVPYRDSDYGLLLIMPEGSLQEFRGSFDEAMVRKIIGGLRSQTTSLRFPKFKLRWHGSLASPLVHLGLTSAFDQNTADFSAIEPERELFISDVIHEGVIEVNEEGTEGAAATAIVMERATARPTTQADFHKPFIFMLVNRKSMSVVLMGELNDPSKARL